MSNTKVGPFDGRKTRPARIGVYFTSPWPSGLGGGYGYWNGKQWLPHANWGGDYWIAPHRAWYWFGLSESASKDHRNRK